MIQSFYDYGYNDSFISSFVGLRNIMAVATKLISLGQYFKGMGEDDIDIY